MCVSPKLEHMGRERVQMFPLSRYTNMCAMSVELLQHFRVGCMRFVSEQHAVLELRIASGVGLALLRVHVWHGGGLECRGARALCTVSCRKKQISDWEWSLSELWDYLV